MDYGLNAVKCVAPILIRVEPCMNRLTSPLQCRIRLASRRDA